MWFSTAILVISLVGLLALFGLKAFELARSARTPLAHLRRVGDPLVCTSWESCKRACRTSFITAVRTSSLWLREHIHNAHLSFDALVHAFATRLNQYLRGRRTQLHQNGTVSTHLKTVLEKTEKKAGESNSL